MKMVDSPLRIALISYSVWAQFLGLVSLLTPEFRYWMWGIESDPYFLWWLGVGLSFFGLIGRFISQDGGVVINIGRVSLVALLIIVLSYSFAKAGPSLGSVNDREALAIAVPLVEQEEGMRTSAYLDIVGVPTICAGTTRGVRLGMTKTLEECRAILKAEVQEYREGLHKFFSRETLKLRLPPTRDAAFTSFAINVGIHGAGNSTATKRLNAANIIGACDALTWWNKAGKRVVRGLVLRRERERSLCLL